MAVELREGKTLDCRARRKDKTLKVRAASRVSGKGKYDGDAMGGRRYFSLYNHDYISGEGETGVVRGTRLASLPLTTESTH